MLTLLYGLKGSNRSSLQGLRGPKVVRAFGLSSALGFNHFNRLRRIWGSEGLRVQLRSLKNDEDTRPRISASEAPARIVKHRDAKEGEKTDGVITEKYNLINRTRIQAQESQKQR